MIITDKEILRRMEEARQNKLKEIIDTYKTFNIKHKVIYNDDGTIFKVTTNVTDDDSNTINNKSTNKSNFNANTTKNDSNNELNLPMPTFCLNDKKYCAKEYGFLMTMSKKNTNENHRYVYTNELDIDNIAKELKISKITLKRNIRKLEQLDYNILELVNTQNGLVYKLNYGAIKDDGNVNKYVTINNKMLKTLSCAFNNNAIKLYCLLKFMCDEKTFRTITNKWLCQQLGLNSDSGKNISVITEITTQLELCGFIESRIESKVFYDENLNKKITKTIKSYRLTTIDEFLDIQSKVKKKNRK